MSTLSELDAPVTTGTHSLDRAIGSASSSVKSLSASSALSAVKSPCLLFSVPPADEEFFSTQIPLEEQKSIRRLLNYCRVIHQAKQRGADITATCRRIQFEATMRGQIHIRGFSQSTIRTKYYEYLRGCTRGQDIYGPGDWRSLWNKAKAPVAKRETMTKPFIDFVLSLYDQNQRKFKPAHEDLLHIWRTHYSRTGKRYDTLPGYTAWPSADPSTGIPEGWSYQSLQGRVSKLVDDFSRAAVTIGKSAASQFRLKVYSSRVGIALAEYYEFDDHEFNLKVNFPGQRKAMRPRGFAAMDVLSACCFAHVFKTTLWDDDEEKKQTLTERDFMWFVAHVLCTHGYRCDDRGTALVSEWGTAAIRAALEQRIADATHGKVRVERSGKFGAPATAGQFEGRSKGNFRFKALIESFFNPLDNILASLPGQVGKDRDHSPEQLHGQERYNNQLLALSEILPAARAALIRTPFLTFAEFSQNAVTLIDHLNARGEFHPHEMEGWERLGFITKQWRLSESDTYKPFDDLLALPDAQRDLAIALIDQRRETLFKIRQLSPREVWKQQHARESAEGILIRLPHYKLPALVGEEHAYRPPGKETVTVRNGVIEIDSRDLGPDTTRFQAVSIDGTRINNGTDLVAYINPLDPCGPLVACDAQSRVVGICPRVEAAARNNLDAIQRAMGKAKQWEAEAMAPLRERASALAREKIAMHEHNAEVLSGTTRAQRATEEKTLDAARENISRLQSSDAATAREILSQLED